MNDGANADPAKTLYISVTGATVTRPPSSWRSRLRRRADVVLAIIGTTFLATVTAELTKRLLDGVFFALPLRSESGGPPPPRTRRGATVTSGSAAAMSRRIDSAWIASVSA